MLAVGMAGLYSMTVVQTRQANQLREMLPAGDVAALNQASTPWQRKLGVYASIENTVVPSDPVLSNAAVEILIDDQNPAPAFSFFQDPADTSSWISWTSSDSYSGEAHYHTSNGNTGSWCQFHADSIPPGDYEIFTTYPVLSSLGSEIPHSILDGTTLVGSVNVNQRTAPTDLSHDGSMFESLGVFTINSGSVTVRLLDGPGGQSYVIGDAVLIRSRRSLQVISVNPNDNGGASAVLETVL